LNKRIGKLLLIFSALAIFSCQGLDSSKYLASGKDLYLNSRKDAIEIKPNLLGLKVDINSNTPYSVVMDDSLDKDLTTTTVGYLSGDASLLTISGRGRVDGIKYEKVQIAAKKYVSVAADFVDKMSLTTDYPLPSLYSVKFYILTPRGIYSTDEIKEADLNSKRNPFYRLYFAQQDVISAFMLSDNQ
jgi:hypothetical protein